VEYNRRLAEYNCQRHQRAEEYTMPVAKRAENDQQLAAEWDYILAEYACLQKLITARKLEGDKLADQAATTIQSWLRGASVRCTLRASQLSPTSNNGIRFMGGSVPTPQQEPLDRDITGIDKPVITFFVPFSKKTR